MRELGGNAFQELKAGRRVVEQVADGHGGTVAGSAFLSLHHLPVFHQQSHAGIEVGAFGKQFKPTDGGNTGQCLASKAQRHDRLQVFRITDFRGGMALDTQQGIRWTHTLAVIGHPNQPLTALFHLHHDGARPRVDTVFHQLLHDRRGALHHFACGDSVDRVLFQQVYAGDRRLFRFRLTHFGAVACLGVGSFAAVAFSICW